MNRRQILASSLALIPARAIALDPPVRPARRGEVVVWTSAALAPLARALGAGLSSAGGPKVTVAAPGSDAAMAGLYTARADIALIGRSASEPEIKAFEWIYRFQPARFDVARGSVGSVAHSPALAVLAHPSNPLRNIALADLTALLTPGKSALPLHVHMPDAESGTGRFLRDTLTGGALSLAWDRITEHDNRADNAALAIARAVAKDPGAIGFGMVTAAARCRIVPVAGALPERDAIVAGRYPLARTINAYAANRADAPGRPEDRAFREFVTSSAGQQIVARQPFYLPLAPR